MSRLLICCLALVFAGCAGSSPSSSSSEAPAPFDESMDRGSLSYGHLVMDLVHEDAVTTAVSQLPVSELWEHLPKVYMDLGFEVEDLTAYDPNARRVAVSNRRVRRLGGFRMSRLLDCGQSMTGDLADKGQVYVYLTTWLEPVEQGTRIHTRFQATAREGGTSRTPSTCATKGRLEKKILDSLHDRAVGGGS